MKRAAPVRPRSSSTKRAPVAWRADLSALGTLVLFGLALWVLDRILREYPLKDVLHSLQSMSVPLVALSLVITAAGYLALVGYDYVAFRMIGHPLPLRAMLFPSFTTFAVSNNAPVSVATAGGLRYKLYHRQGLSAGDAAAVAGINVVTYLLGLSLMAGLALALEPAGLRHGPILGQHSGRILGWLLVLASMAYMAASASHGKSLKVWRWKLEFPEPRVAAAQLGISVADWLLSSGALFVLLRDAASIPYIPFMTAFLLGQIAALVIPIPGGIGVFEAVVLLLRPTGTSAPAILAALLLYRIVYYVLPLLAAGAFALIREINQGRRSGNTGARLLTWLEGLAPTLLAATTFLSGLILCAAGAIPGEARFGWLKDLLPLAVIDTSRFLASVIGAVLLVLAWGLQRRVRLAYRAAVVLFGLGMTLTLFFQSTFDWRLIAFLGASLAVMLLAARYFPDAPSVLRAPLGREWTFAVGAILVIDLWILTGMVRTRDVPDVAWWRFVIFGPAPPAVRAAVAAAIVILLFIVVRLLWRYSPDTARAAA